MPESQRAALAPPSSLPMLGDHLPVDIELTSRVAAARPTLAPACTHTRQAIKNGDVFVVCHTDGQIHPGCDCGQGVYFNDTRFLSGLTVTLEGRAPVVLAFTAEHSFFSRVEAMNDAFERPGEPAVARQTLHVAGTRAVDGGVRERLELRNFNPFPVKAKLSVELRADFKDIFEVRGFADRQKMGTFMHPRKTTDGIELLYQGADGRVRHTRASFDHAPLAIETCSWTDTHETGARVSWEVELAGRGGEWSVEMGIMPCIDGAGTPAQEPAAPIGPARLASLQQARDAGFMQVKSSHAGFQQFIARGVEDLLTLGMPTPEGLFPTAGIPWYCCPFGRDSLITAYQSLPLGGAIAVATLKYLARHQGHKDDPYHEEAPGKILHELRRGELAELGEIPFSTYYGTIDATPLWLVLLAETYRWTGDLALIETLWPNVERALAWIDTYGDMDGDGFVEYARQDEKGLSNQGWKDSFDSIVHPDGTLATAPIALAEVQGYVYDAKVRLAPLARLLGHTALADKLAAEAVSLKTRFNTDFWVADGGYYALALDRDPAQPGAAKRQVQAKTSNPGHALWSGLIATDRVAGMVESLLAPDMYNGWGIRTMSSDNPNYNPISYHNGTVWPHDVSLIAKGMADHGFKPAAARVLSGLYDCAEHFEYRRLPELFCGFERQPKFAKPVPYPVACSPQAWAAGTPLLLLTAVLGLQPDAANGELRVVNPTLPAWLPDVTLEGLQVGAASVDLRFKQVDGQTTCTVIAHRGDELRVVVEPA